MTFVIKIVQMLLILGRRNPVYGAQNEAYKTIY